MPLKTLNSRPASELRTQDPTILPILGGIWPGCLCAVFHSRDPGWRPTERKKGRKECRSPKAQWITPQEENISTNNTLLSIFLFDLMLLACSSRVKKIELGLEMKPADLTLTLSRKPWIGRTSLSTRNSEKYLGEQLACLNGLVTDVKSNEIGRSKHPLRTYSQF